jgi:hypothetical protein
MGITGLQDVQSAIRGPSESEPAKPSVPLQALSFLKGSDPFFKGQTPLGRDKAGGGTAGFAGASALTRLVWWRERRAGGRRAL